MISDTGRDTRPDRVRLGVVGLGAVAQAVHLPLLDRLSDHFAIASICDLSPSLVERLGDRYRVGGRGRFTDAGALIAAGTVDAVAVLSSGAHGSITAAALDAGLTAFVEKPLALSLREADALAAHGGIERLQVGYMKLYDPAVERASEAIAKANASGAAIRAIEVTVLHPTSARQLAHSRLLPPATDIPAAILDRLNADLRALYEEALGAAAAELGPLYGQILLGSVIHDLALIRVFGGHPVAIDAVDAWPAGAWPPSVGITGRLPSEARIDIRWHFLPDYPAYREIVRVVLDDRTVELEFPAPYLLHAPTRLTVVEREGPDRRDVVATSVREAFEEELLAFHRLVVDGSAPRAGIAEARADVVTCQLIARRRAELLGIDVGGEAAAGAPAAGRHTADHRHTADQRHSADPGHTTDPRPVGAEA
jgi:predicted dehydrogenase